MQVMTDAIISRIISEANYVIETHATVRATAKIFQVSKSTVDHDLLHRLIKIQPELYTSVYSILQNNWNERGMRGGQATRQKYRRIWAYTRNKY
jgi:putative DeoR family transcriptional regulator (stage III sporulation protein D)